jgi:hypothetical protein
MSYLKKYWPTIASIAGATITFLLPSLQAFVASHPKTAAGVLIGCIIAAYHSSAPKDQN